MKYKNVIGAMSLLIASLFVPIATAKYYAGYQYNTGAGPGVSGTIKTRNHNPPANHFGCEWVCIVLSKANSYYIQVGYSDGDGPNGRNWFWEKRDVEYHDPCLIGWIVGTYPSVGTTYYYEIDNPEDGWDITVKKGSTTKWTYEVDTNPTTVADLQAMCETTSTAVTIDGSEFRYLSYYTEAGGGDWRLWDNDDYEVAEDTGYEVTEINNYSFDANDA